MSIGDHEDAILVFETVVSLEPDHEDARYSRAVALLEVGRVADAVFHLDAYVRDFPAGKWTDRARATLADLVSDTWSGE
jgi:predicted Zn-dependent protease